MMNVKYFILISLTVFLIMTYTSCDPGKMERYIPCGKANDITRLITREDVISFREKLPADCTCYLGSIIISGNQIKDFSPLDFLKGVGNLKIQQLRGLQVLKGFPNLDSVYMELSVTSSDVAEIHAFPKVSHVGTYVMISRLPELHIFSAFDRLMTCKNLVISANPKLKKLPSFRRLKTVRQSLLVVENHGLKEIDGFNTLDSVLTAFMIDRQDSLTRISGFESLKSEGNMGIINNPRLKEISGFSSLRQAKTISIKTNPGLEKILAFKNLEKIAQYGFFLSDNPALKSVPGLLKLKTINSRLEVKNNLQLEACCFLYEVVSKAPPSLDIDISGNGNSCQSREDIIITGPCK